ncbi:MAG: hypothetical protein NZ870_03935, partial [bacterium]|nr:hypothetical protein [bacterium]
MDLKGKKVCVIILRTLGDVANSIYFFAKLKSFEAFITALVFEDYYKLIKNYVDDFILTSDEKLTKRSIFYRIYEHIKIIKELKKRHFDIVFDLTDSDRTLFFSMFAGRYRIASATKYSYRRFFYNDFKIEKNVNTAIRFLKLLGTKELFQVLIESKKPDIENYAVIHYGAALENKRLEYKTYFLIASEL